MVSKIDYRWRYSLEEDRYYTYDEIYARREDNPFPNQMNMARPRFNEEIVKEWQETVLRNPETYTLPWNDPEEFMPEVFMTEEEKETREGRLYEKFAQECEREEDGDTIKTEEDLEEED